MNVGSSYSTVKQAIASKLQQVPGLQDTAISDSPPLDALKVMGPSGSGKAIWIADTQDGEILNVVSGHPDLWLDEAYSLTVVFQSLPRDTSDGQIVTDLRVDEMLYEFWAEAAKYVGSDDPWGIPFGEDENFVYLQTFRGGFRRFIGPVPNGPVRPSRCELDIRVEARIHFPST